MKTSFTMLLALGLLLLLAGCSDDDSDLITPELSHGTVVINTEPDSLHAEWTCTHTEGTVVTGQRDTTLLNMPLGAYTLAWQPLFGFTTPAIESKTLAADSTASFTGTYVPWDQPPTGMGWLFDVRGTEQNNVYAVGTEGTLIHFDGTSWSRIDLGLTTSLVDLALDDQGDLWTCGQDGVLFHQDGLLWQSIDIGTHENLYALGLFGGVFHVGGYEGALRRFQGGQWQAVGTTIVTRDPIGNAPLDTLQLTSDIVSITTISHFGLGGAYWFPEYAGGSNGMVGTQGMILRGDPQYDWLLDPLDMTDLDPPEWVVSSTSDPVEPLGNFLGTSAGGLFRLQDDGGGVFHWMRQSVAITSEPQDGINDLWLSSDGDLYLVTQEGRVVYLPDGAEPEVLFEDTVALTGIWGTGPGDLWVVGLWENQILHLVHDPATGAVQTSMQDIPGVDRF